MKENPAEQLMGVTPVATVEPLNRSEQRPASHSERAPKNRFVQRKGQADDVLVLWSVCGADRTVGKSFQLKSP